MERQFGTYDYNRRKAVQERQQLRQYGVLPVLSFSSPVLSIEGGNSVDLSSLLSGGGTDSQSLTFVNPILSISNGNSVDLSGLVAVSPTLSFVSPNLTISGGNTISLASLVGSVSIVAQGAVVFGSATGTITGNVAAMYWDDTTKRLGILETSPTHELHVGGAVRIDSVALDNSQAKVLVLDSATNEVKYRDDSTLGGALPTSYGHATLISKVVIPKPSGDLIDGWVIGINSDFGIDNIDDFVKYTASLTKSFNIIITGTVSFTQTSVNTTTFEIFMNEVVSTTTLARIKVSNRNSTVGSSNIHDLPFSITAVAQLDQNDKIGLYVSDASTTVTTLTFSNLSISVVETSSSITIYGGSTYTHTQIVPNSTWNINHGLGSFPSVSVVDSSGNKVMGDVQYVDSNNLSITFTAGFAGKAYLN